MARTGQAVVEFVAGRGELPSQAAAVNEKVQIVRTDTNGAYEAKPKSIKCLTTSPIVR